MLDVIIIGAGPAGMTAAIYGSRAMLNCLVLEKEASGGQILDTYEVDNYPGIQGVTGYDLATQFRDHAEKLGADFQMETVIRVQPLEKGFQVETDQNTYTSKSIIIAAGASYRRLGVPGEELLRGRGVSNCATCDGAFFRKKRVAVVGGGDVAVEDAIYLARSCEHVTLIHRRDALRAVKSLQDKLLSLPNVTVIWNSEVDEILGEEVVSGVRIRHKDTGVVEDLSVNGVFVAVGIVPATEVFKGLVEMDPQGYILAGEDTKTSFPGIFAAGDVRKKVLRQVVTAVADGACAITAADEFIH